MSPVIQVPQAPPVRKHHSEAAEVIKQSGRIAMTFLGFAMIATVIVSLRAVIWLWPLHH
jgi:hypothetical protein